MIQSEKRDGRGCGGPARKNGQADMETMVWKRKNSSRRVIPAKREHVLAG